MIFGRFVTVRSRNNEKLGKKNTTSSQIPVELHEILTETKSLSTIVTLCGNHDVKLTLKVVNSDF